MKKFYFALAVVATAGMFNACVQEQQSDDVFSAGENDIVFGTGEGISTKSVDECPVSLQTFSVRSDEDNSQYFIEESVSSLYSMEPVTKGTPAYTENAGDLYKTFLARAYAGTTLVPALTDVAFNYTGKKTVDGADKYMWSSKFASDPWGGNTSLRFFMRMPIDDAVVMDATTPYNATTGAMKFHYTTPAVAKNQKDILFASRVITKSENDALRDKGGVPVLFQHALTAVKFRMGNELKYTTVDGKKVIDNTKTRTYITKVEFIGLRNDGTCTIIPTSEDGDYVDIIDNYSSAKDGVVAWEYTKDKNDNTKDVRSTATNPIYQIYTDDDLIDFTGGSKFPESFYSDPVTTDGKSGLDKNLNDEDATMTFWLIPQTLDANVKVKVTFQVWDGEKKNGTKTLTLKLGELQSGKVWRAGELRTYTIKPNTVDIELVDKVKEDSKINVVIRNTGNVDCYVRAAITAHWVDEGYTDATGTFVAASEEHVAIYGYASQTGDTMVTPWSLEKERSTTPIYGEFTNLPGNGWVLDSSNGYYYYTSSIGPGESPSTTLFDEYKITYFPDIWMPSPSDITVRVKHSVHLEMDIKVQSVVATAEDGTSLSYVDAWAAAVPGQNTGTPED